MILGLRYEFYLWVLITERVRRQWGELLENYFWPVCCSPVLGSSGSWPILLALSVIPSLVSILVMYFMPESPRYLILTLGKVDEGREALSQLRGSEESSAQVEAEVKEILAEKRQAEDETSPKQDRDGGVDEVDENNSKTLTVLDLLKVNIVKLSP